MRFRSLPGFLLVTLVALVGTGTSSQASVYGCYEDASEARMLLLVGTLPQDPRYLMINTYDPDYSSRPEYYLEKALCFRPSRLRPREPSVGDVCYHLYNYVQISFDAEDRVTFWGEGGEPELYMRAHDHKCDGMGQ
jgi:hypothetical protein